MGFIQLILTWMLIGFSLSIGATLGLALLVYIDQWIYKYRQERGAKNYVSSDMPFT